MPLPPSRSPTTSRPVPSNYIHSSTLNFLDTSGRSILLRGANFCSSAKTPVGRPSHQIEGFWEGGEQGTDSFVGRVVNLEDGSADGHLRRLREWGWSCLRYVTTWESLEHEGPGKYDEEYMDYTIAVLRKCGEYGFRVYIDPHQDLFSRFSGGSGAPFWALQACALHPRHFTQTGSAYIQCEYPSPLAPDPTSMPPMIWASNYTRIAVATLMTLFYAGSDFAPLCVIDGVNIQDYLQNHYLGAYRALGERIRDKAGELLDEVIIGWDSINEPNHGLVGLEDLRVIPPEVMLKVGPTPSMWQGLLLASGRKQTVENWKFGPLGPKRDGSVTVDPEGRSIWASREEAGEDEHGVSKRWGWTRDAGWDMGTCIWALHGVWDPEGDKLLKPDYFRKSRKDKEARADFGAEYWRDHWVAWAKMVRSVHEEAIHFVAVPVLVEPPVIKGEVDEDVLGGRVALSTHFYDGLTLVTKHWWWFNADAVSVLRKKSSLLAALRFGESAIRSCMRHELSILKSDSFNTLGNYPTMIGEIGIPYDLDKKAAYAPGGDYGAQTKAMDASLNACDGANTLNFSLWNYDPEGNHKWGDNWNGEDLSVWSEDDRKGAGGDGMADVNDGARALPAFCRPYPRATVGEPVSIDFEIKAARFVYKVKVTRDDVQAAQDAKADEWAKERQLSAPTEIYVPFVHYARRAREVSTRVKEVEVEEKRAFGSTDEEAEGDEEEGEDRLPRARKPNAERVGTVDSLDVPSTIFGATDSRTRLVASSNASSATNLLSSSVSSISNQSLDIKVELSSGRYEVDGQILRWWYDPSRYASNSSTSSPSGPNGEREEWIKITRGGGPITAWKNDAQETGVLAQIRSAAFSSFDLTSSPENSRPPSPFPRLRRTLSRVSLASQNSNSSRPPSRGSQPQLEGVPDSPRALAAALPWAAAVGKAQDGQGGGKTQASSCVVA